MATNCCTTCGMAVRASVDNCAAGAEAAAANKIAGIETLRNDFNNSSSIVAAVQDSMCESRLDSPRLPALDGQQCRSYSIFILPLGCVRCVFQAGLAVH